MVWSSGSGRPVGVIGESSGARAARLLEGVAWLVIASAMLQVLMFGFGRDQGIYAVVGSGVLDGQMPYRDLWDFKPPGIFLIFALAEALFGKAMWGVRLLEVAGFIAMVFSMRKISSAIVGDPLAGTLAGAVAALIHAELEFWHTAQPETFGGYLTVLALMLTLSDDLSRRRVYRWLATGALFGAAFLLKPPLGGGALVCAAYLARREWLHGASRVEALRPVVLMALAAAVPLVCTGAWFWFRGAWGALAFTLFEFTPGYTALGWEGRSAPSMLWWGFTQCFFRYSALAPVAIFAALLMRPAHSREREGVLLVFGVIAMHLTGVAMQGKFFPYHYGATFPLLAILAGVGLLKAWRLCHAAGPGGVLAFGSFMYLLTVTQTATVNLNETFWERSQQRLEALASGQWLRDQTALDPLYAVADYNLSADRAVASYLRQETQVTDWVLVWGFEPAVYWLSERRPATKYIYNVAQRASWDQTRAREDLLSELTLTPPSVIVVQHHDIFPAVTGDNLDSASSLRTFPELASLLEERFRLAQRVEDFDIYVAAPASR